MGSISTEKIRQHFSAAMSTYDSHAVVQRHIANRLVALLQQYGRQDFEYCWEIGCGTGSLTRLLNQKNNIQQWDIVDLCDCHFHLQNILPSEKFTFYAADATQFKPVRSYDLIASANAIQWFYDKVAFINRCADYLRKNGILLLNTFAPNHFHEIKETVGVGLDYPSKQQWQTWLQTHFEILHLQEEEMILHFSEPKAVLKHLKNTGVTATSQGVWNKKRLQSFIQTYQQNHATEDGEVKLSYVPLYIIAKRK